MSSQFGCGSNPDALRNHWEMFDPLVGHLSLGWSIQSPKSSNQGRQPRHQKVSKAINIFSQQCLKMQFYTNKNAKSRLGGSSMIRFEKRCFPMGPLIILYHAPFPHHAARLDRWAAISPDIVLWVETLRRRNPTRPQAWVALAWGAEMIKNDPVTDWWSVEGKTHMTYKSYNWLDIDWTSLDMLI